MFKLPLRSTPIRLTTIRSISLLSTLFGASPSTNPKTTMSADPNKQQQSQNYPTRPYTPKNPTGPFPYTTHDLTPLDPGNDTQFYAPPRFVTHIDNGAINGLKAYYDTVLPQHGTILDFCSSWISHYPPRIYNAAVKRGEHMSKAEQGGGTTDGGNTSGAEGDVEPLVVLGTGMNDAELSANPVLAAFTVQDLNVDPDVKLPRVSHGTAESSVSVSEESSTAESRLKVTASTCVVSIDYLTDPVSVLSSIRAQTGHGGTIHLAISNRCFPTKVVGRWLKVDEQERLEMVGDYLWWGGWRDVEIVEVVRGGWLGDPLWVVRGVNTGTG